MKGPRLRRRVRWCSWHNGLSDTALLIQIHEGAGTGSHLYACTKCRIAHGLTPLSERTI